MADQVRACRTGRIEQRGGPVRHLGDAAKARASRASMAGHIQGASTEKP